MKVIFNLFLILLLLVLGYFVYAYYMNRKTPVDPQESGDAFRKPAASADQLVEEGSFIPLDGYILAGEISMVPDNTDHIKSDHRAYGHGEEPDTSHIEQVEVLPHDINTIEMTEEIPDPTEIKDILDWEERPDMMNGTNTAIPVIGAINFETEAIESVDTSGVEDELDWQTVTEIEIGNQALSRMELSELQKSLREAKMQALREE